MFRVDNNSKKVLRKNKKADMCCENIMKKSVPRLQ